MVAYCRSIMGCRCGVLYPCWRSNLSLSQSLTLYNFREVSKSSLVYLFDVNVGLFGSKEVLCLLMLQEVVGSWIRSVLTVGPYVAR